MLGQDIVFSCSNPNPNNIESRRLHVGALLDASGSCVYSAGRMVLSFFDRHFVLRRALRCSLGCQATPDCDQTLCCRRKALGHLRCSAITTRFAQFAPTWTNLNMPGTCQVSHLEPLGHSTHKTLSTPLLFLSHHGCQTGPLRTQRHRTMTESPNQNSSGFLTDIFIILSVVLIASTSLKRGSQ